MTPPSNQQQMEPPVAKKAKIDDDGNDNESLLRLRKEVQQEWGLTGSAVAGMSKPDLQKLVGAKKELVELVELVDAKKKAERYSMKRLIQNPPTMCLENVGNDKSHTGKSKHEDAEVVEHDVKLQSIDVGELNLDGPSRLLLAFKADRINGNGDNIGGTYATESDVSSYISPALEDAQGLVEQSTKREFYVHHKFSLFSDRPDHLVLFDKETNDPILAVEDKKPWKNGKEEGPETIPGPVAGQVFDYNMELRAFGHSAPFVILSTFHRSWLFWHGDDVKINKLVALADKLPSVLQSLPDPTSPTQVRQGKRKTPSPPELKEEGNNNYTSTFGSMERKGMCKSKAYESDKLVPLLYTALLCSLARNPAAPCKTISQLSMGHNGLALKLDTKSYEWGSLQIKVGVPVQFQEKARTRSRPAPSKSYCSGTYFVTQKIARGETLKAFGDYDHKGHPCVIKMYVERAEDDHGKLLPIEESRKQGEALCKLEVDRLTTFYDFLKGKVSYQVLNKFPCVIMPFFEPLTKDERMKLGNEEETRTLKNCLSNFKDKYGKCWKYSECDIRWRHVGYFGQGKEKKMVMFDLAELEPVKPEEFENVVKSQMNDLVDRLPDN